MYDSRRVKNEPSEPYQRVSRIFERNGPREITRENKYNCTDIYRHSGQREDNGGGVWGGSPPFNRYNYGDVSTLLLLLTVKYVIIVYGCQYCKYVITENDIIISVLVACGGFVSLSMLW